MDQTTAPTKSLEWQRAENDSRRQRGQTEYQVTTFQVENFILNQARKLTGISQGDFIRLSMLEPDFCLSTLESDIVALSYRLEESQKTSLRDVEAVEAEIAEYAAGVRARLRAVEERVRQDWSALGVN